VYRKPCLTLLALALLSGCASTYNREVVTAPGVRLARGAPVLIGTPRSASYNNTSYAGSGEQTATVVHSAFARFSNKVTVSAQCADLDCLATQGGGAYQYLVIPEILHWEDRATQWSGVRDKVEVKLIVVDGTSRAEVASMIISGKSQRAAFGSQHPQDLLAEPIRQYVDGLY
jgi:hypothetical protein